MSIYFFYVPLWLFWNSLPFLLLRWLWNDQVIHRKLITIVATICSVYYVWGYFTFEDAFIAVPLAPIGVIFILSFYLMTYNMVKNR